MPETIYLLKDENGSIAQIDTNTANSYTIFLLGKREIRFSPAQCLRLYIESIGAGDLLLHASYEKIELIKLMQTKINSRSKA